MPTVVRNQPFPVSADHNGVETATYDLLIDGALFASLPVSALQAGTISFSNVVVTTVGNHIAAVRANNGIGASAVSADLPFGVVVGTPTAPTNLRIGL